MAVMETVNTGPSFFKVVQLAVQPLATSLKQIEKNTASLSAEQQIETVRAERVANTKAEKIDNEQSSLLQAINKNIIKSMSESGLWKWFKNNWGKLLLGAGILLLHINGGLNFMMGGKSFGIGLKNIQF